MRVADPLAHFPQILSPLLAHRALQKIRKVGERPESEAQLSIHPISPMLGAAINTLACFNSPAEIMTPNSRKLLKCSLIGPKRSSSPVGSRPSEIVTCDLNCDTNQPGSSSGCGKGIRRGGPRSPIQMTGDSALRARVPERVKFA
jgi:hypothetical protein